MGVKVTTRPRGRPPKVKRGRKPLSPPTTSDARKTNDSFPALTLQEPIELSATIQLKGVELISSNATTPTPGSSKRSSPEPEERVRVVKRSRAESSPKVEPAASRTLQESMPVPSREMSSPQQQKVGATSIPARRSTRNATVQSTQISEGSLRPPGPPNLEAALNIALRNLESETWRCLWVYHKKHPDGPLPTPAVLKGLSPQVRAAAEAVDKADNDLEDAIDELVRANIRKKARGGGIGKTEAGGGGKGR